MGAEIIGRDSGLRTGMARDKLIFIIICSLGIGVAVIVLAVHLFPRNIVAAQSGRWQCLECDHTFKKETSELPPIECPKCGQDAVGLTYRTCPQCGKKTVVSHWSLTEQGKAEEEATRRQEEETGTQQPRLRPLVAELPIAVQYWAQQTDGSYGWTDWMNKADPMSRMVHAALTCDKCQSPLYPVQQRRSSRKDR